MNDQQLNEELLRPLENEGAQPPIENMEEDLGENGNENQGQLNRNINHILVAELARMGRPREQEQNLQMVQLVSDDSDAENPR